jgi:glutathione-regulated potassium-efflux system protein KefB
VLNAAVIVSMALTPLAPLAIRRLLPADRESFEGVEMADGLSGTALLIGFGRFGQVVSQPLLARGIDVSIIDNDTEMIRAAARFGFKIYYGDGTRLDVLRAAGARSAKIIAVCVDRRETANRIVEVVRAEFPIARLLVRAYDRGHTLDLINAGVDYQIRETVESAIAFGEAALRELGVPQEAVAELIAGVRTRDAERLEMQQAEGIFAGRGMLKTQPTPTPLTPPKRESQPLSEETAVVAAEQDGFADDAPSDR